MTRATKPLWLDRDERELVRETLMLRATAEDMLEDGETPAEATDRSNKLIEIVGRIDTPALIPGVEDWADTDLDDNGPGAWLSGPNVRFAGTDLHLYALRVHDVDPGQMQQATDEPMEEELDHVLTLVGGRAETTTIDGFDGEYVVYAIPSAD